MLFHTNTTTNPSSSSEFDSWEGINIGSLTKPLGAALQLISSLFKESNFLIACSGPLPTLFNFNESKKYRLIDSIVQQQPKIEYDNNFGVDLAFYENKSIFYQKIEPIKNKIKISGNISYMTCNESMCIPYDLPFEIKVNLQD